MFNFIKFYFYYRITEEQYQNTSTWDTESDRNENVNKIFPLSVDDHCF